MITFPHLKFATRLAENHRVVFALTRRRGRCYCPDFTAAIGGTTDIAEPGAGSGQS
jgi:hypothetical protein